VKKPPGAGRNPASFVPRRARTFGRRAARPEGCGRLDAGVPPALGDFLYAQKVTKDAHERGISISPSHDSLLEATQEGRPRPSWITPMGTRDCGQEAKASASQGAHALSFRAERGIPYSEAVSTVEGDSSALTRLRMTGGILSLRVCTNKSYKSTRGARKRRNHNAITSDSHGSNDKRSGLATRKGKHRKRSFRFSFW
jgi:hypothetical protein